MEAVLCLSPEGKRVDSEGFSTLLYDALDKGGSRLCLCIGPAEGFTDELRGRASLLSLSDLTLPSPARARRAGGTGVSRGGN